MSTAKWDGPKLTIVTKQEMNGQVAESTPRSGPSRAAR